MLDLPVFKKLAHNDTGAAVGHQGGMVIPAGIEDYFPDVKGTITPLAPTADVEIRAVLVVSGKAVDTVHTRYQYQTWGGTRSPERRLTANLGALRNKADADDVVLFQRDLDDFSRMVITLVKKTDPEYEKVDELTNGKRWGVLGVSEFPVSNKEIEEADKTIHSLEVSPFSLFDKKRKIVESFSFRKARNSAFRIRLISIYESKCAVTGIVIEAVNKAVNLDAAHIVPVEAGGSDDPRNGLLLSKDIHWAFDRGLIYFDQASKISVSDAVRNIPSNKYLASLHGAKLRPPIKNELSPHPDALEWHRQNRAIV